MGCSSFFRSDRFPASCFRESEAVFVNLKLLVIYGRIATAKKNVSLNTPSLDPAGQPGRTQLPSPRFSVALPPPPRSAAPVAGQIVDSTTEPAVPVYFPPDPIVFAVRRAWCKELQPHGSEEPAPTPLTPKRRSQARSGTRTTAPPSINCKMSSDSESDDDTNYERKKVMVLQYQHDMAMLYSAMSSIVGKYCKSWVMKADPRTSRLSGFEWLRETIGTPEETYTMLRMNANVFFDLHDKLVAEYGLKETCFVTTYESLAMYLWTLGGCESNRRTQNRFKHGADTVHRKFHEVLQCVVKMSSHNIRPQDPNFHIVHDRIKRDKRAYSHLKDFIGAIDGTHIRASIPEGPSKIRVHWKNRCNNTECDGGM
ncbi:uncharacterized protein [Triticum aestivum]|uniref:uncharacterized protein n=1 Tax=Triticum aestivum TaxID=4565 RepID=UPI001D01F353|nr:uncharacterized protein LOC123042174 [Triticum aestivum]